MKKATCCRLLLVVVHCADSSSTVAGGGLVGVVQDEWGIASNGRRSGPWPKSAAVGSNAAAGAAPTIRAADRLLAPPPTASGALDLRGAGPWSLPHAGW